MANLHHQPQVLLQMYSDQCHSVRLEELCVTCYSLSLTYLCCQTDAIFFLYFHLYQPCYLREFEGLCPSLVYCCYDKHHNQKQFGYERIYLQPIIEGSQGRTARLEHRNHRGIAYWIAPSGVFNSLSYIQSKSTCLVIALPTVGWACQTQPFIDKIAQNLSTE